MGVQTCLVVTMCENWINAEAGPLICLDSLQGLYLRTNQKYKAGCKRNHDWIVPNSWWQSRWTVLPCFVALTAWLPRQCCGFPTFILSYFPSNCMSLAIWPLINCCHCNWPLDFRVFSHSNYLAKQVSGREKFNNLPKVTYLISNRSRFLGKQIQCFFH